jgi:ABC-type phosphate transport system substrate-binding protein
MHKLKIGLVSTVAAVSFFGAGSNADAQVFGGGSTLASVVYRQLFDCYYLPVNTSIFAIAPGCAVPNGDASGVPAQILYAPVGSGAGVRAFVNHDCSTSTTTGLGTPAASNTVPYTSTLLPTYGYPGCHFGASDAVLSAAQVATYNANGGPAKWGMILQIPTFTTPVTIMFNGKDGAGNALNITNPTPAGGSSGLNLSRTAVCGIFSGHITQWNDPILTATNGGTALGTGAIKIVHRSDSSGTTFLLTQALLAQCTGQVGPSSTGAATFSLYEFPWSDRNAATTSCGGGSDALPFQPTTVANWPDLATDQCGVAIPAGAGTFINASGSGGVTSLVQTTNGAIGYVSPDFTAPVKAGGVATANLQSQYDINNSTGAWIPPTAAAAQLAMSNASADFSQTGLTNPLNWSAQGVAPNPYLPGAYPISGFTWINFYQCYSSSLPFAQVISEYIIFHYTDSHAQAILGANGFAPIPSNWLGAVGGLVLPNLGTAGAGACAAVTPGA